MSETTYPQAVSLQRRRLLAMDEGASVAFFGIAGYIFLLGRMEPVAEPS